MGVGAAAEAPSLIPARASPCRATAALLFEIVALAQLCCDGIEFRLIPCRQLRSGHRFCTPSGPPIRLNDDEALGKAVRTPVFADEPHQLERRLELLGHELHQTASIWETRTAGRRRRPLRGDFIELRRAFCRISDSSDEQLVDASAVVASL